MQIVDGKIDHKELRIENTSLCNAHCVTCPREKMTRQQMVMPLGQFKNLVSQAKDLGCETVSVFGYGEPLLDEYLVERIQYCTDLGMDTFLTSNGSLMTTDMASALIRAGLKSVRFSIHAILSQNYEKVHRGLRAEDTYRNVINFYKIARGACKVFITCMPLNGETVEGFKEAWGHFDGLEVWKPHNWAGGRKFRKTNDKERVTCRRAFTGPIQILADGRMIVCCFDYDGVLTIGDTNTHSIKKILTESTELERYRKLHLSGELKGLPCEHCDQRVKYKESPLLYSDAQEGKGLNKTFITKSDLAKEN